MLQFLNSFLFGFSRVPYPHPAPDCRLGYNRTLFQALSVPLRQPYVCKPASKHGKDNLQVKSLEDVRSFAGPHRLSAWP